MLWFLDANTVRRATTPHHWRASERIWTWAAKKGLPVKDPGDLDGSLAVFQEDLYVEVSGVAEGDGLPAASS